MRLFKKYVTCIMTFFIPSTCVKFCLFYSNTSPVLFTKNKLWNERREFAYMAVSPYHVILKEVETDIVRHNWIFKYTHNSHWQICGIIIFFGKYYIVISDTMVDSFFDVFFLLIAVNNIRTSWITKKERLSYRKKYKEEFVWGTSLFWLLAFFSMSFFVAFLVYSLLFPKWRICWVAPIKIHNIAIDCILCDDIMSERSNI